MNKVTLLTVAIFSSMELHGLASAGCGLQYCYRAEDGTCADAAGNRGLNAANLQSINSNRNAQCMDLSDTFLAAAGTEQPATLGKPHELHPVSFAGWDLRGADLSNSVGYSYVFLKNAKLQGANLRTYKYMYAVLSGEIDGFTKLPDAPEDQACVSRIQWSEAADGTKTATYRCSH